jgi:hypothetical protein
MSIATLGYTAATIAAPQAARKAGGGSRSFAAVLQSCRQPRDAAAQGIAQGTTAQATTLRAGPLPSHMADRRTAGPAATSAEHRNRQRACQEGSNRRDDGALGNSGSPAIGPGAALVTDMRRAIVTYTAVAG